MPNNPQDYFTVYQHAMQSAYITANEGPTTLTTNTPHSDSLSASDFLALYKKDYEDIFKTKTKKDYISMLVKDHIHKNRVIIFPYAKYSRSAAGLASEFHTKITNYVMAGDFKLDDERYVCVNWGSQQVPALYKKANVVILNEPSNVKKASNKLSFFKHAVEYGVSVPDFTDDVDSALSWMEHHEVLGRSFSGTCGNDIVFASEDMGKFITSDFFTKYKKKKDEYRIHVFCGEVIDIQRKAVRKTDENGDTIDTNDIDFRIRNLANGFVFVKQDVSPPPDVITQSLLAVESVELDFGAVDVIWNEYEQKAYVLEVNTAPGLEGSTIQSYVEAIKKKRGEV